MGEPRTKIIATLGPQVFSKDKIKSLIESGVNIFRINFSHGTKSDHQQMIQLVHEVRRELKKPVGLMMDTKGFEMRVDGVPSGGIEIIPGKTYKIGDKGDFSIRPAAVIQSVEPGMELLFDDGYLIGHCTDTYKGGVFVTFKNGRLLKENKNVHIPCAPLDLPLLSPIDREDITFACQQGVEWIAASFISSKEEIHEMQKLLQEQGVPQVQIIAKVETTKALENFDEIVAAADGIMVARGDLGIELRMEQLPAIQKRLVCEARRAGKVAIVATQMLESMIENPRPTRAEVSDVANAIFEMASGVMLSAETAAGKYPIEAVERMRAIAIDAEKHVSYNELYLQKRNTSISGIEMALAHGAVSLSIQCKAVAIVIMGETMALATAVSALRPSAKVYVVTSSRNHYNQLSMLWGVNPLFAENTDLQTILPHDRWMVILRDDNTIQLKKTGYIL